MLKRKKLDKVVYKTVNLNRTEQDGDDVANVQLGEIHSHSLNNSQDIMDAAVEDYEQEQIKASQKPK